MTYPCHNARFEVRSGTIISQPALDDPAGYDVREENGRVPVGTRHEATFSRPSGSDDRTVAIVGAGAGGSLAAEHLRREGFAGRIVMITPEYGCPYDRVLLSQFYRAGDMGYDAIAPESVPFEPAFSKDVGERFADMYRTQGVQFYLERHVSRITGSDRVKRVELSDGTKLPVDVVGTIGKGTTAIRYGVMLDAGRRITSDQFEAGIKSIEAQR